MRARVVRLVTVRVLITAVLVAGIHPASADRKQILSRTTAARVYLLGDQRHAKNLPARPLSMLLDILADAKPGGMSLCWEPHNGIDLLGADGRVLESIVVCFTCSAFQASAAFAGEGADAPQEGMLPATAKRLKALFKQVGVRTDFAPRGDF